MKDKLNDLIRDLTAKDKKSPPILDPLKIKTLAGIKESVEDLKSRLGNKFEEKIGKRLNALIEVKNLLGERVKSKETIIITKTEDNFKVTVVPKKQLKLVELISVAKEKLNKGNHEKSIGKLDNVADVVGRKDSLKSALQKFFNVNLNKPIQTLQLPSLKNLLGSFGMITTKAITNVENTQAINRAKKIDIKPEDIMKQIKPYLDKILNEVKKNARMPTMDDFKNFKMPDTSGSGRPMKFPYTLTAKMVQFPWKFYYNNNWVYRYHFYAVILCIPIFQKITNIVNSPSSKAKWAEYQRKEAEELAHHGH